MTDRTAFPTRRRRKHPRPQELLDAALDLFIERREKAKWRAVTLLDREIATQAMANVSRGFSGVRIIPIEVLARKPAQASPGAERDPA